MSHLAQGVRNIVTKMIMGIIAGVFHPNMLMVLAYASAVYAADRTWEVTFHRRRNRQVL